MRLPNETAIQLSRKKISGLGIVSLVGVAIAVWMFTMDDRAITRHYRSPVFVHGFGVVFAVFCGFGAIYCARKLFDGRPGLQFTPDGIVDNASGIGAGFVPWSDITGTQVRKIGRNRILVVKVTDPEKYCARGGALRRSLKRMTLAMCGSPIAVSSPALAIGFDDLVRLFDAYLSKYGVDRGRPRGGL
jgi:hypothetical protein